MPHVNIEPQARPAVTAEDALLEQAAADDRQLDTARVPIPADRLPAVAFPQTLLVDESVPARRAAGLAAAPDEAPAQGPRQAHARPRHLLDDAVFQQIVRSVQRHRPALREARAIAEDEAAHLDIRDAVFVFPLVDAKGLPARRRFGLVCVRVGAVGHPGEKRLVRCVCGEHADKRPTEMRQGGRHRRAGRLRVVRPGLPQILFCEGGKKLAAIGDHLLGPAPQRLVLRVRLDRHPVVAVNLEEMVPGDRVNRGCTGNARPSRHHVRTRHYHGAGRVGDKLNGSGCRAALVQVDRLTVQAAFDDHLVARPRRVRRLLDRRERPRRRAGAGVAAGGRDHINACPQRADDQRCQQPYEQSPGLRDCKKRRRVAPPAPNSGGAG